MNRTVGVIGIGAVGGRVVKAMLGLNAKVLCYQHDHEVKLPEGARWADLDTILANSDVVTLHVPLVAETERMIDRRALSLMRPTAVLINTSRGQVVDQDALLEALEGGAIRAAGLDVFETEPLPADHKLRHMPNVIVTPHVGGAGVEIAHMQVGGTLDNIELFVSGRRPERLVNPQTLNAPQLRAAHLRSTG